MFVVTLILRETTKELLKCCHHIHILIVVDKKQQKLSHYNPRCSPGHGHTPHCIRLSETEKNISISEGIMLMPVIIES